MTGKFASPDFDIDNEAERFKRMLTELVAVIKINYRCRLLYLLTFIKLIEKLRLVTKKFGYIS